MKLKEFGFRNICSYGNKLQVIKMPDEPQLILISGDNGGGKTTISTAIKFAAWGRDTKRGAKDIANWFNGAGYSYANFDTIDGRKIEVHRGSRPDFQELKIDGITETPSSKAALLALMENEFIGIHEDVLNNTMILSINDFKSFIRMSPQDKRKIINRLFAAENLDEMHELLKIDYKVYDETYTKTLISIQANESMLSRLQNQISVIAERLAVISKERLAELNESIIAQSTSINLLRNTNIQCDNLMLSIQKEYDTVTLPQLTISKENECMPISNDLMLQNRLKAERLSSLLAAETLAKTQGFANLRDEANVRYSVTSHSKTTIETELRAQIDNEVTSEKNKIYSQITAIRDQVTSDSISYQAYIDSCNAQIKESMTDSTVLSNQRSAHEADIKTLDKKIALYNSGICAECDTVLTDAEHKHGLEAYIISKNELIEKIKIANLGIEFIKSSISKLETQMAEAKSNNSIFVYTKNSEIKTLESKLLPIQNNVTLKYKPQFDILNDKFQLEQKEITEKLATDEKLIADKYNSRVTEIDSLVNSEFESKIIALRNQLDSLDLKYEQLKTEASVSCTNKKNETFISKTQADAQILMQTGKLNELNTELANISNSQADEIALQEAKKSLSEIEVTLASLQDEKLKTESQMRILAITKELFGDDGIKRVIFDNVLPTVNGSIEKLVEKLEYKYPFSFDDKFDPKVTYMGMEIDPSAISSGEDKKMDIIVILAIIELIKLKHPDVNFMFLDEIFNTLDIKSIGKVVQILREYMLRFGMTIFVISHTPVPMEYFDKVIEVKFAENFSDMVIK